VPDYGIIPLGGQVHLPIVEIKRQLDAGMLGKERINRGPKMHSAERHRRGDAQRPNQSAAALGHFCNRFFDFMGNAGGSLSECNSILGQAQLARAPMHEPHTKATLELNQAVADDGLGQSQAARRLAD
jgi:hypothetical protein